MKIILVAFFSIFYTIKVNSQQKKSSFCRCEIKGIKSLNKQTDQKIILNSSYSDKKINLKLINNSSDTIYLFKSYFDDDITPSKYIYRYNKQNNTVNISFLPLIPYLYTKYSDRIILQDRIIKDYQTVYDFYKIPPLNEYSFSINTVDLMHQKDYIEDFDVYKFKRDEKIQNLELSRKTDFKIQLAYYQNVNTICNYKAYYFDPLNFNENAKKFKILESDLNIK